MRLSFKTACSFALLAFLSACQSNTTSQSHETAALHVMERITTGMNACWFRSKDAAFAAYKLSPELDSYSGQPRVLLVDRHRPETKPVLVVMAEGEPAKLQAFGPLMDGTLKARITADVNHWARGNSDCPARS